MVEVEVQGSILLQAAELDCELEALSVLLNSSTVMRGA